MADTKDQLPQMLDWKEIKEKFPQSFRAFISPALKQPQLDKYDSLTIERRGPFYFFGNVNDNQMLNIPYHRTLYDFFDKFGILITTSTVDTRIIQIIPNGETLKLVKDNMIKECTCRIDAEFKAYDFAFSLLEEKLKELLKDK